MTKRTPPFSPEVRERAVRMVQEHQGEDSSRHAAIQWIASKIGCSGETLRNCIKEAENSKGARLGPTSDERERIKALERRLADLLATGRRRAISSAPSRTRSAAPAINS